MKTDHQKSRVYGWERQYVAPLDRGNIPYNGLQQIVDYIWSDLGMEYAPKICPMPKQNTTCWADATRQKIRVGESGCPTWVLLHELAHSMTSDFDGRSHHHGGRFMETYLRLICKYLPSANQLLLMASLQAHKIEYRRIV